ncbi:MAG: hypothetical protein IKB34_04435, partial [Clostridia bacterium]|nr:hypothetical protein [Clostridia bacterium]
LGEERFVRMNGSGDANVIIKDNVITDYLGADDDYIKVTLNNVAPVIENNTMTRAYRASNADELKVALTSAADGENIYLAAADFGGVGLYNTTNNGHRYEYANYQTKNINIIGQNGTTFSNLRLGENDTADVVMTGWTFKNIGFTGDGLIISMNNKDVTVENCRFTNTELMNTGTSAYQAVNFTVKNCIFDGSHATRKTQLALQNNDGVTITGCTFNNAAYNAMNITEIHGNVTIDGNTINGTANRPFRFVIADPSATLIIKNNTVVSGGNSEGQLVKADGTVTVGNITLDGNTWNGKSDSDVTAGMVGSDYIVK